ncbi:hypothetical protein L7F22_056985 [Adiantum nelumboides]|nr:hypothetical protein [Adiantum nelumboides]
MRRWIVVSMIWQASLAFFFICFMEWAHLAFCCSKAFTFNGSVHSFVNCLDLPAQGASIAWTLADDSLSTQGYYELELAFSGTAPSKSGWVGWGLNPDKPQMAGSSVWVAFNAANGSTLLPYQLTPATLAGAPLKCSPVDYVVKASSVEISGMAMSMLLTLHLNASMPTTLNHVWNRGASVSAFQPSPTRCRLTTSRLLPTLTCLQGFNLSRAPLPPPKILRIGMECLTQLHGACSSPWV